MPKLLLHVCCCHCAAFTLKRFSEKYPTDAFWYNPNIAPSDENVKRLEAMRHYAVASRVFLIEAEEKYVNNLAVEQRKANEERCYVCFYRRLLETARYANANGYTAFSTSLLISPHQKHHLLKEVGEQIGRDIGLPFIYEDLRRFYSQSRTLTKSLQLYAQRYCGCLPSKEKASAPKNNRL